MPIKVHYPKISRNLINIQEMPIDLVNLGQFNIMINKDGVIYDVKNPKNNSLEIMVQVLSNLAQLNNEEKTAFDSIKNKDMLLKIADWLKLQYDKFIENKPDKMTTLLFRQGRASILSLMEALAVCAGKLEDKEKQYTIMNQLKELIKKETFCPLRDFSCESAVTRMVKHELPKINELKELIYPTYPPKCQKLNIKRYVDDSGTKIKDHMKYLKSLRFNCKTKNEDYFFNLKEKPVTIHIPNPHGGLDPSIYEDIDNKSINLIDSWGHAGYGSRIEKALSKGKEATGDGKILAHYECTSSSEIGEIKNSYPRVQLITTTETTTDNLDEVCSKWVAVGVLAGWKWEKISRYVIKDLTKIFGKRPDFKEFNLKNHYIFPHMHIQAEYIDRDNDGIKDSEDHLYNVTCPTRGDLSFGFDPIKQDVPFYALNGENLNKAIDNLKLVVQYNSFLGKSPQVPWEPEKIKCDGFFSPEKKDTNAFHFYIDKNKKKLHISLSKYFSHTPKDTLSRMLSYEAGCFLGKESGLSPKESVILGLAMLDRAIHQEDSYSSFYLKYTISIIKEMLFLKKYNLSGVSFGEINKWLGTKGEDDGTKDDFKRLVKNCKPVLKIDKNLKNKINIEKIHITKEITIPFEDIGYSSLKEILAELGIKGKITNYTNINENYFHTVSVVIKDDSGNPSIILLGFDTENNLCDAGRLNLNINELKEKGTEKFFYLFAEKAKLNFEELYSVYKESAKDGKSVVESILATLKWARLQCPPGTIIDNLFDFFQMVDDFFPLPEKFQLKTEKPKFTDLFPADESKKKVEKDLFDWIENASKAANIDKKKLENIYLSKLAEGNRRSIAIKAMLESLPDFTSKNKTNFPVIIITELCLDEEPEVSSLIKVLQQKAGVNNEDILMLMVEDWVKYHPSETQEACRNAAKLAIAENKSPVEVIKLVVKAAHEKDPTQVSLRLSSLSLSFLQNLGVITNSEKESLKDYLRKHFHYNF